MVSHVPNYQISVCRDAADECWDFMGSPAGIHWRMLHGDGQMGMYGTINPAGFHAGSAIAAIKGGKTHPARIYYVGSDRKIREIVESNMKWFPGDGVLAETLENSSIAATSWNGLDHIRLYYQDAQGRLCELCYDKGSGWFPGATLSEALPPVPIAAYSFDSKGTHIVVAYVHNSEVRLHSFSKGKWSGPQDIGGDPAHFSRIAAAEEQNTSPSQFIVYQRADGAIRSLALLNGTWKQGAVEAFSHLAEGAPLAAIMVRAGAMMKGYRISTLENPSPGKAGNPDHLVDWVAPFRY